MRRVIDGVRAGSRHDRFVEVRPGFRRGPRHEGRHMVAAKSGLLEGRPRRQASAKEFAAVTGTASIGALVLALMFSSTGQASPGAGAALPPAATAANAPASSTASTTPTTSSPTTSATPSLTPTTAVEVSTTVTEVVLLPFARQTVNDGALEQGKTVLRTAGRAGSKTVTWTVRNRGGVEIGRTISGEQVTAAPVDEVTAVGHQGSAPGAKATSGAGGARPTPAPATRTTQAPASRLPATWTARGAAATVLPTSKGQYKSSARTSTGWMLTTTGSAASRPAGRLNRTEAPALLPEVAKRT